MIFKNKFNCKLVLFFLLLSAAVFAQNIEQTYRNPVIGGDVPDPTVIRVGGNYYAAATTSDFAPNYPIFHSTDLINWTRIGAIFNKPPAWIKGDCWAPELSYHDGTYYVYYTARKKENNVSCIGVATSSDISKGFEDKGVLIEWGKEAIDAFVFQDDDGKRYISWKAYGLDNTRPIELLCSEISKDGLSLVGEHFSLTDYKKGWADGGCEGQSLLKHGDYYYLFYSIGGCCDNRCDYRVLVARAKSLKGNWEPFDKNPILQGGGLWKCSGHGTPVQTPDNRYFYLYHAYHAYDFEFVGRQGLLDELRWDEKSGWPYFRYGNIPSEQAEVPFPKSVQKKNNSFYDDFKEIENDRYWVWDMNLPQPVLTKADGILTMTVPESGFSFRGVNPQSGNYTMDASVVVNKESNLKGLCVYGNSDNKLVWGIEAGYLKLYKWEKKNKTELFSQALTVSEIYLRIESVNARTFRFYWSDNRKDWTAYSKSRETIDGNFLPQWGKGVRAGLLVENDQKNNTGKFAFFLINNGN
jgi:beta-xylosidase